MHLLHLIPRCIGGGPERSLIALARELGGTGGAFEHTVLVLDPPVTPTMLLACRRVGVRLVTRWDDSELDAILGRADVTVIHFWNHPALYEFLRTKALIGPVMLWSHVRGTDPPQVLTADVANIADLLALTSEAGLGSDGARVASANGVPVVIQPAVLDVSRLRVLTGGAPPESDTVVVGYIGSLDPTKLHPDIAGLCAAVDSARVRFLFVGPGDSSALRKRFDAAGIAHLCTVRGPTEDIRSALAEMDVFGYPQAPSTYATSDLTVQEAMWVGVPPVVLEGSAPLWVVDGESGLVADVEGYSATITRLVDDADLRIRLSEGARSAACDHLDPARAVLRLLGWFDDLATDGDIRERGVVAGAGESPAQGFVRSLGATAGPFAVSAAGIGGDVEVADRVIARSVPVLAVGEGGIVHHRNVYPADPHLRLWSGLVATAAGDVELAATELAAAAQLGLGDDRPGRYADADWWSSR